MSKFSSDVPGNHLLKVSGKIVFKLKDIIDKSEYTKYSLHKATKIRYDTICRYCKGEVDLLNIEYLKILCKVLHCNVSDILEFQDEKIED